MKLLVLTLMSVLLSGCATGDHLDTKLRRSSLEAVKKRSAGVEFSAAVKSGAVSFYAVGSLLEGYSLPGLTKEEAAVVERESWTIVNEFPTDPVPLWATQEYWDAVERFASAYNRLVYRHLSKKGPNQTHA